jgi:hypothetical protein
MDRLSIEQARSKCVIEVFTATEDYCKELETAREIEDFAERAKAADVVIEKYNTAVKTARKTFESVVLQSGGS